MKIVHLCISQSYFDNWGYQENLISSYQADMGHDVCVISTNKIYPNWLKKHEKELILSKGKEYFIDKVRIIRLKAFRPLGTHVVFTYNLYKTLLKEKPDIIFHHEPTNFSTIICSIYKLLHPKITYFIDSHSDKLNSAGTKISEWLYFKIFLRVMHKLIAPFVKYYYGVTPSRCDFLRTYIGIPNKKIKFLPIGCDTRTASGIHSKENLRSVYNIPLKQLVVVSGGKMGKYKGTDSLITAVEELRQEGLDVSLILFGTFLDEESERLARAKEWIQRYGWCDRIKSLELLKIADIACWPIHHTTLNEDALAVGTPLVIRKTSTTEHLVGLNGEFLYNIGDINEIKKSIRTIFGDLPKYQEETMNLSKKMSYYAISEIIIKDSHKKC